MYFWQRTSVPFFLLAPRLTSPRISSLYFPTIQFSAVHTPFIYLLVCSIHYSSVLMGLIFVASVGLTHCQYFQQCSAFQLLSLVHFSPWGSHLFGSLSNSSRYISCHLLRIPVQLSLQVVQYTAVPFSSVQCNPSSTHMFFFFERPVRTFFPWSAQFSSVHFYSSQQPSPVLSIPPVLILCSNALHLYLIHRSCSLSLTL